MGVYTCPNRRPREREKHYISSGHLGLIRCLTRGGWMRIYAQTILDKLGNPIQICLPLSYAQGLPALESVDGSLQGSLEWLLQTADGKLCGSFRSPLRRSALDELYTSDGQWPMSEECLSFLDGYLAIMVP